MISPSSSEQVIRKLYQITNNHHLGFEEQIRQLLRMGLERFDLDIAILSKIDGEDYVIQYCVTPVEIPLQSGDKFNFDATYCSITCAANQAVAIEHVGQDDRLAVHPAYQAFGLEAYIGIPIYVQGELYGTLNFSSPLPFPRKFHDFDLDALQLMASWIEVELVRRSQEKQLSELNKELQYMADHDSLTNVLNRRGIYSALTRSMNKLCQKADKGLLAIVDIDNFKELNDTYGHKNGDEVLVSLVNVLDGSIGRHDVLGRLGGDEFLIFLPGKGLQEGTEVFKSMQEKVSNLSKNDIYLTLSIGFCSIDFVTSNGEVSNTQIEGYISLADKALYIAKSQGGNRLISLMAEG
ncbi:GGDEF domain-containing protein [Marinomonas sp.]